jgi:hypothetical protein
MKKKVKKFRSIIEMKGICFPHDTSECVVCEDAIDFGRHLSAKNLKNVGKRWDKIS